MLIALIKSLKRRKINVIQLSFPCFFTFFLYLLVNQFILVPFDIYFPFPYSVVRVVGKVWGRWQLVTVWSTCQAGERHRDRWVYNAITCSRIGRTCDNWRASSYAVNKRNVPRTNWQVKSIKASCLQRGWKVRDWKKLEDICPGERKKMERIMDTSESYFFSFIYIRFWTKDMNDRLN